MDKISLKETYAYHKTGNLSMNVYKSSNDIPYHWHDEYEFLCITKGECECIINGKSIILKNGQAILVNSGELHTINSGKDGQFFAVVFHPYVVFGSEFNHFHLKKLSYNRIYSNTNKSETEIISLLNEIYSEFFNRHFGFELTLKALIIKIFGAIYKNKLYTIKESKTPYDFDNFANILQYIHHNFSEKLLLDDVATYANFSKSYIIRLFKKNTGKTFSSYLNSYRIYKAVEMLRETDKNILEISEACGFNNVAYFIKIFKQNMKITPYKYRTK